MCPAIRDGPRRRQVNKRKSDVEFRKILEFGLLNAMFSTNRTQIAYLASSGLLSKYERRVSTANSGLGRGDGNKWLSAGLRTTNEQPVLSQMSGEYI